MKLASRAKKLKTAAMGPTVVTSTGESPTLPPLLRAGEERELDILAARRRAMRATKTHPIDAVASASDFLATRAGGAPVEPRVAPRTVPKPSLESATTTTTTTTTTIAAKPVDVPAPAPVAVVAGEAVDAVVTLTDDAVVTRVATTMRMTKPLEAASASAAPAKPAEPVVAPAPTASTLESVTLTERATPATTPTPTPRPPARKLAADPSASFLALAWTLAAPTAAAAAARPQHRAAARARAGDIARGFLRTLGGVKETVARKALRAMGKDVPEAAEEENALEKYMLDGIRAEEESTNALEAWMLEGIANAELEDLEYDARAELDLNLTFDVDVEDAERGGDPMSWLTPLPEPPTSKTAAAALAPEGADEGAVAIAGESDADAIFEEANQVGRDLIRGLIPTPTIAGGKTVSRGLGFDSEEDEEEEEEDDGPETPPQLDKTDLNAGSVSEDEEEEEEDDSDYEPSDGEESEDEDDETSLDDSDVDSEEGSARDENDTPASLRSAIHAYGGAMHPMTNPMNPMNMNAMNAMVTPTGSGAGAGAAAASPAFSGAGSGAESYDSFTAAQQFQQFQQYQQYQQMLAFQQQQAAFAMQQQMALQQQQAASAEKASKKSKSKNASPNAAAVAGTNPADAKAKKAKAEAKEAKRALKKVRGEALKKIAIRLHGDKLRRTLRSWLLVRAAEKAARIKEEKEEQLRELLAAREAIDA